jgi:hypothetical protein
VEAAGAGVGDADRDMARAAGGAVEGRSAYVDTVSHMITYLRNVITLLHIQRAVAERLGSIY